MRSVLVVVAHILCQESLQMPFVEDNYVIKQVSSTTSNPALRNTVLPRAPEGNTSWLASDIPHR